MSESPEHPHLRLVREYLAAIEAEQDARVLDFFDPSVCQREFPNQLVPAGAERGLEQIREGARKGRQVVEQQRYEISSALVDGDRVAVELTWTARLKLPVKNTPAGGQMRARCGMFFRIQGGRIVEQHNYDCFDPF